MMKKKKPKKNEIRWHRWFGTVFKETLTPLGLEVHTEFPVMTDPPLADVVIIRKKDTDWTPDQFRNLPDGVRDSMAGHIIIEFKHTESLNDDLFCKTFGYRAYYKENRKVKNDDIQVFMAVSKKPSREILEKYGYGPSDKAGVYYSKYNFSNLVTILSLNELADERHNALCRLFASRKKEKIKSAIRLLQEGIFALPESVGLFIIKIADILFRKGGDMMELTPEDR
ncbi:MAG: hypothetical protein GY795_34340, partial [Desulfobacterales bacterium]|nr:hypothetical protein [Desulfobacterales bacterium]